MQEHQLRHVPVRVRLHLKFNPQLANFSPLMKAIVGHLLGIDFVQPAIREICVTSDDFVLARVGDEVGANHFIGTYTDLVRNWGLLLASSGLTTLERMEAESLFAEKIGMFGRVMA